LCYTGKTRLSANIIKNQTKSYAQKKETVVKALDELKQLTKNMKDALLLGNLDKFGDYMHEAWLNKKKLDKILRGESV
jgi:D-glycero-alpha-D-manno-heptose-7-phosphate kinase